MSENNKSNNSTHILGWAFENSTKLSAALAAITFTSSVLFDWGYFKALGLSFSEVPTSISDHARSALLWAPLSVAVIPVVMAWMLYEVISETKKDALTGKENKSDAVSLEDGAKGDRIIFAIFTVVFFLIWLAFGDRARSFLFFFAIMAWSLISVKVTPVDLLGESFAISLRSALVAMPVFFGAMFFSGYGSGCKAVSPDAPLGRITVVVNGSQQIITGNIVRSFEKVTIIIDDSGKVSLLRPDQVTRYEKAEKISRNVGVLCGYWKYDCPADIKAR